MGQTLNRTRLALARAIILRYRNAVQWKKPGGHIAACGLAWLNRARPDRRISLLSSVRVPRSKLRNRIAQLLSLRWASAIVSFRIASDR